MFRVQIGKIITDRIQIAEESKYQHLLEAMSKFIIEDFHRIIISRISFKSTTIRIRKISKMAKIGRKIRQTK